jgi:hypothetical protein
MADREQRMHDILAKVKDLAIDMGRTPTAKEIIANGIASKHDIGVIFGGNIALLHAIGLVPQKSGPQSQKITNKIFEKRIEDHLDDHVTQLLPKKKTNKKFACMGDLHEPFSHDGVKQDFKLFVQNFKPDYIIQVGDAFDMFSTGRFPRSHNIFTPKDEETQAKKNLENFWSEMIKASPKAQCIQLVGNHDVRPLKRVLETMPSLEHWAEKYFNDLLTFDGVKTIIDPREEFIVDGIAFHHGYRSQLGDHRNNMLMNFVGGHTHRGGVVFRNIRNEILWELNCGLAGDPTSKGLSYTNQKMNDWTLGFGAIDSYGPRFIPY